MTNRSTLRRVSEGPDYAALTAGLQDPEVVVDAWMNAFSTSRLRLPGRVDRDSLASSVEPIAHAMCELVAPDRAGRVALNLRFLPGAGELREVEKAVSFVAANLGASGLTGFDVGALLFAFRDVLCARLQGQALAEMQHYMEWLAVLAGDSLATGREQALVERMRNELDEGTPLIMITPELPAALFVCRPDRGVVAGVFGRLLLTVVRTAARAVILDVRGMSVGMQEEFAEPLERFLCHPRVAGRVTVFGCGVRNDDANSWRALAAEAGVCLVLEGHFDLCVRAALDLAGWRLIPSS
jgi:hypothetical protein